MQRWKVALLIAVPTWTFLAVFALFLRLCLCKRRRDRNVADEPAPATLDHLGPRWRPFDWTDHPPLVSAAVENGWAGFAFTVVSDSVARRGAETGWEIGPGSKDLMQRVNFNPGVKDGVRLLVSLRTVLPLPGPALGPLSFPREAYWEVTVLSRRKTEGRRRDAPIDGERTGLMYEAGVKSRSDNGERIAKRMNSRRPGGDDDDDGDVVWLGMAVGSAQGFGFPGGIAGSVGFSTAGAVYLDGKLCCEDRGEKVYPDTCKKPVWGEPNSVVGCGFDPSRRQVFFTVDSVLMRNINCESDVFSSPLYPTIAANFNASLLVNLGQSPFKYGPANSNRTADPCFYRPGGGAAAGSQASSIARVSPNPGIEDSGELFSMGRIDSEWMMMSGRLRRDGESVGFGSEWDESELFEIVLDGYRRD
ncbi:uncharacterized protein LOC116250210 [Nymphaea colorata]|nr:uncharacterized protein LOC116250210 [Nymphaea colorata]